MDYNESIRQLKASLARTAFLLRHPFPWYLDEYACVHDATGSPVLKAALREWAEYQHPA